MVLCALTTIVTFFLYVKARMAERSEYHGHEEDPEIPVAQLPEQYRLRNAALDRQEQRYRSVHFISLFIFVVLGVLLLVIISNRQTVSY